jgi:hypothetical protein
VTGLTLSITRAVEDNLDETPPDVVPSIDQEKPVAAYPNWRPEDTRVICYTTDPAKYPKDRVVIDGVSARLECERDFGEVLEVRTVPQRYFLRVRRGAQRG